MIHGKDLREVRTHLGWSQRRLADALHCGLNTVIRWQSAETVPTRCTSSIRIFLNSRELARLKGAQLDPAVDAAFQRLVEPVQQIIAHDPEPKLTLVHKSPAPGEYDAEGNYYPSDEEQALYATDEP